MLLQSLAGGREKGCSESADVGQGLTVMDRWPGSKQGSTKEH